jgi:hypothetical protein
VSLLSPEDHGRVLREMTQRGRIPMSFSHGDFDFEYLSALTDEFKSRSISFAAHFDKFMFGRRGVKRPKNEECLIPFRKLFCDMFHRLRKEGKVDRFFLAHNMTITPGNVDEVCIDIFVFLFFENNLKFS